jgi:heptosyltransferase-2
LKIGVFNTAFVGDLVLMGRLIDALHRAGHEIILFSNNAGCSLYENDSRISQRISVSKKRGIQKIFSVYEIASQIKSKRLDVLFLAHRSLTSRLIAHLSRPPRIISFTDSLSQFPSSFFERFLKEKAQTSLHESDRYLELARGFVDESVIADARLTLQGDSSLKKFLTAFPVFFDDPSEPFFICSPGSVWETKKYPPTLLAHVVGKILLAHPRIRCVLSGGPSDAAAIDSLVAEFNSRLGYGEAASRLIDARQCLPLPELIELTRRARFILTPDSAPLHIGSATGTPTFAFFGPTPFDTGFGPQAKHSQILSHETVMGHRLNCQPCSRHGQTSCPLGHHRCLSNLQPDVVADRVLEFLSRRLCDANASVCESV